MLYKPETLVYNPDSLTPTALKIAQGHVVTKITDADFDSWLAYEQRMELLKPVWDKLEEPRQSREETGV